MGEKYIMNTTKTLITTLLLTSVALGLSGCATSGDHGVLPSNGPTMTQIYDHQMSNTSDAGTLDKVRGKLPPASYPMQKASYQQASVDNSINAQVGGNSPKMLPNPMIQIYVYPHFDGDDQDYVPGHQAYTKLYKETHFALPGEATE